MTIPEIIEKAAQGGFIGGHPLPNDSEYWPEHIHELVLMPTFWQAVGKVMDCVHCQAQGTDGCTWCRGVRWNWERKFMDMPLALIEGKTLEQFISSL